ncbi:ABC transporter permease [Niveispirillum sp. KHB5.9]|uniref:ABC transporter permease n=1 Tax=Niveispirillum sp. KHB5.9 TaxID=3400269 RepID=UPI003A8704FF
MVFFLARRLLQSLSVLLVLSALIFTGIYMIGNPVDILINPEATPADRAAAMTALGLDRPLPEQYLSFLGRALQGDLGHSFVFNEPAIRLIIDRFGATLELAIVAMGIAVLFGIPLGLYAGLKPASIAGRSIETGSILGFSLPSFWQGMMLVLIFSVTLGWLPSGGRGETGSLLGIETSLATLDGWRHLLLPAVNLALYKLALVIRLVSSGTREAMPLDFVGFARAKGLSPARVVCVHILKYILIPIITVLGLEFGGVIAFAVVTETIFGWPGMGKLIIDSINQLDRPVIVAYLLVVALLFMTINLVTDIAYTMLDPRLRLGGGKA